MGERLPLGAEFAGFAPVGYLVTLDPKALGIGRPAPEAARLGAVATLEIDVRHERESSRGRAGGSVAWRDADDLRGGQAHRRRVGRRARGRRRRRRWRADHRRRASWRRAVDAPTGRHGHRRPRAHAAARPDRRPRALHVRPDRGLDRDHRTPFGRRDRADGGRSCGARPPGWRDDRPGRRVDPEPRGRPARRDRGRPRAGSDAHRRRHGGRDHRRARLRVRSGGRRTRGAGHRHPARGSRRCGRGQGRGVRGGHADDDRPCAGPDGQRRPRIDRGRAARRSSGPPPSSASGS